MRAAAVFLLCAALAAGGDDPWVRVRTEHFDLFTTAGERSGRGLALHFERVRGFFLAAFGSASGPLPPTRVIAFRSQQEFQPYKPSPVAGAYFHRGVHADYIVMGGAEEADYPTAIHEYTHLLVAQHWPQAPPWFNEGLAQLYSTFQARGGKIAIGQPPAGAQRMLSGTLWIPLRDLLAADQNSQLYRGESDVSMFYAESWALVDMLLMDKSYSKRRTALIEELRAGDSAAALVKVYGKPLARIEAGLENYAQSYAFPVAVYRAPEPPAAGMKVESGAGGAARPVLEDLRAELAARPR